MLNRHGQLFKRCRNRTIPATVSTWGLSFVRCRTDRPIPIESSHDFTTLNDFTTLMTTLLNEFATKSNTTFPEILAKIQGDAAHDYLKRSTETGADITMDKVSYFQRESERLVQAPERVRVE